MSARRGGVNWLLVWIGVALLVGAGLIVGVSLVPGAHAESRGADKAPAGFAGPLQDVRVGGLDLRVPADFQVVSLQSECASRPSYDGVSPGFVVVDGFDWGSVSSCPAQLTPIAPVEPPAGVPALDIAPYTVGSGFAGLTDPAASGTSAGSRRAAGQTVDVRTAAGFTEHDTLLIFTLDHVVVDVGALQPDDRLVTELLDSARG